MQTFGASDRSKRLNEENSCKLFIQSNSDRSKQKSMSKKTATEIIKSSSQSTS